MISWLTNTNDGQERPAWQGKRYATKQNFIQTVASVEFWPILNAGSNGLMQRRGGTTDDHSHPHPNDWSSNLMSWLTHTAPTGVQLHGKKPSDRGNHGLCRPWFWSPRSVDDDDVARVFADDIGNASTSSILKRKRTHSFTTGHRDYWSDQLHSPSRISFGMGLDREVTSSLSMTRYTHCHDPRLYHV